MNSGLHSATQISTNPACWLGLASPISHTILWRKHEPEWKFEGWFGGVNEMKLEQTAHTAGKWTAVSIHPHLSNPGSTLWTNSFKDWWLLAGGTWWRKCSAGANQHSFTSIYRQILGWGLTPGGLSVLQPCMVDRFIVVKLNDHSCVG